MKKITLTGMLFDSSSILSVTEKKALLGGGDINYPCSDCNAGLTAFEYAACMANCSNGGNGPGADCAGPDVPCDPGF